MKKIVVMITVLALCLGMFVACKSSSSAGVGEAKKLLTSVISDSENLISELKSAKDGNAAAQAIMKYGVIMRKMLKDMQALSKKYPNINKAAASELVDLQTKLTKVGTEIQKVMADVRKKYMGNKDFMKAVMGGMLKK